MDAPHGAVCRCAEDSTLTGSCDAFCQVLYASNNKIDKWAEVERLQQLVWRLQGAHKQSVAQNLVDVGAREEAQQGSQVSDKRRDFGGRS